MAEIWDRSLDDEVRREGEVDGKSGIPAPDDTDYPPALRKLHALATGALTALQREFLEQDKSLKRAYCDAQARVSHARNAKKDADERLDDTIQAFREQHGHDPEVAKPLSLTTYAIILIFAFALEIPLNMVVFRGMAESEWASILMSTFMAVILMVAAHFWGRFVHNRKPWGAQTWMWMTLLTILPLGWFIATAILRQSSVAQGLATYGVSAAQNPMVYFWVFLIMAIVGYVVAVAGSMELHAPVKVAFAETLRCQAALEQSEMAQTRARDAREHEARDCGLKMTELRERFNGLCQTYQQGNLAHRQSPAGSTATATTIEVFRRNPELSFGAGFENPDDLDWSCG